MFGVVLELEDEELEWGKVVEGVDDGEGVDDDEGVDVGEVLEGVLDVVIVVVAPAPFDAVDVEVDVLAGTLGDTEL